MSNVNPQINSNYQPYITNCFVLRVKMSGPKGSYPERQSSKLFIKSN